jgi:hypothetical protein
MSSAQDADAGANFWGVLINPDKSPTLLLEQLCLGIAQLMVSLVLLPPSYHAGG